VIRQELEDGSRTQDRSRRLFERLHESGYGSRQVLWLTLTGDFTRCCRGSGREAGFEIPGLKCDQRLIQRIKIAR
jgi:hypothetical protein